MPELDTTELRDLQALSGGILSRNLLHGSGVWKINRDITHALGNSADTIDALRRIIAEAPHAINCASFANLADIGCSCWKSRIEETR